MRTHARWLFGTAATFNALVGLALLFARRSLGAALKLDPIVGTNVAIANLCGAFIVLFGVVYALVALDPVRYRAFVPVSVAGKLVAVVAVAIPWLAGTIDATLPLLVGGDLVFAGLFAHFLRRHAAGSTAQAPHPFGALDR
ncbi:MAG: hypothetical protein ABI175_20830 [Polyangiales bacterium]